MTRLALAPVWLAVFAYVHVMRAATSRLASGAWRAAVGLAVALAAYLAVMLLVILLVPPGMRLAVPVYTCAMAIATLAAATLAGRVLPGPVREHGMAFCVIGAMAFPALVASLSEPDAPIRALYGIYVIGSAVGGGLALLRGPAALLRMAGTRAGYSPAAY